MTCYLATILVARQYQDILSQGSLECYSGSITFRRKIDKISTLLQWKQKGARTSSAGWWQRHSLQPFVHKTLLKTIQYQKTRSNIYLDLLLHTWFSITGPKIYLKTLKIKVFSCLSFFLVNAQVPYHINEDLMGNCKRSMENQKCSKCTEMPMTSVCRTCS